VPISIAICPNDFEKKGSPITQPYTSNCHVELSDFPEDNESLSPGLTHSGSYDRIDEKQLKEYGNKFSEGNKKPIEQALEKLKKAHQSQDLAAIETAMEGLNKAWEGAAQEMYAASGGVHAGEAAPGLLFSPVSPVRFPKDSKMVFEGEREIQKITFPVVYYENKHYLSKRSCPFEAASLP
jgi:hypothetical protein